MKVFRHESHTVYVFREWKMIDDKRHQSGICIIRKTGSRIPARSLFDHKNWRFTVPEKNFHRFWHIRLPFFLFNRDNCGIEVGHPNMFLWIIL